MSIEVNSIDVSPAKPGLYNIEFEGVRSMLPLFAEYDGKCWHMKGMAKTFFEMGHACRYYQDVEPNVSDDSLSM